MAPDDDYERWRQAEDDRREGERRADERRDRTYDALGRGDFETLRHLWDLPPAEPGRARSRAPAEAYVPTPADRLRKHGELLRLHLNPNTSLTEDLRAYWTAQIEELDIEQPAAGLAAIEAMWEDFQWATRNPPPASSGATGMVWRDEVPRVGHEILEVRAIFREVLAAA